MLPPVASTRYAEEKRFPHLTVEQLSPEQQKVADEVAKVSSLGIQGPYNVMPRSPVMAQRMIAVPAARSSRQA